MPEQVIRPRLSLADTRLLLEALDHIPTKTVEEVEAVSDLGARLQTSAQNGPFRSEWFRLLNG
jgi:hypothetical protein